MTARFGLAKVQVGGAVLPSYKLVFRDLAAVGNTVKTVTTAGGAYSWDVQDGGAWTVYAMKEGAQAYTVAAAQANPDGSLDLLFAVLVVKKPPMLRRDAPLGPPVPIRTAFDITQVGLGV